MFIDSEFVFGVELKMFMNVTLYVY